MSELDKLIEAVEAGSHEWSATFLDRAEDDAAISLAVLGAWCGSLDAAQRLHTALLPGWAWSLESADVADVWPMGKLTAAHRVFSDGAGPARAWLLAILRAVRATKP